MSGKQMTVGKLKELLKNVPDDATVNVLNLRSEYTSSIDFWFNSEMKFVDLKGKVHEND